MVAFFLRLLVRGPAGFEPALRVFRGFGFELGARSCVMRGGNRPEAGMCKKATISVLDLVAFCVE